MADAAGDSSADAGSDHSGGDSGCGDNCIGRPGSAGITDRAGNSSVGNNSNTGSAAASRAGPGTDSEDGDSTGNVRSPTGTRSDHHHQQHHHQEEQQQQQLRQVPLIFDGKQSLATVRSKCVQLITLTLGFCRVAARHDDAGLELPCVLPRHRSYFGVFFVANRTYAADLTNTLTLSACQAAWTATRRSLLG